MLTWQTSRESKKRRQKNKGSAADGQRSSSQAVESSELRLPTLLGDSRCPHIMPAPCIKKRNPRNRWHSAVHDSTTMYILGGSTVDRAPLSPDPSISAATQSTCTSLARSNVQCGEYILSLLFLFVKVFYTVKPSFSWSVCTKSPPSPLAASLVPPAPMLALPFSDSCGTPLRAGAMRAALGSPGCINFACLALGLRLAASQPCKRSCSTPRSASSPNDRINMLEARQPAIMSEIVIGRRSPCSMLAYIHKTPPKPSLCLDKIKEKIQLAKARRMYSFSI